MVRKEDKRVSKKSRIKKEKKVTAPRKRVARAPKAEEVATEPVARAPEVEETATEPTVVIPSVKQLISLLGGVSSGVCLFTKDDQVEYCNQRFSEITGLQETAVVGKKLKKNALWGARGGKDEFQDLFAQARESGLPLIINSRTVVFDKQEQRIWNIQLLPQHDENGEYDGMGLAIEDITDQTPRISNTELANQFCAAAVSHGEVQPLIEDVTRMLKEYSRCSSVKIVVMDKLRDLTFKAETGVGPGLWDGQSPLTAALIDDIFGDTRDAGYQTNGGSIYLEDVSGEEGYLEGGLRDLVVNASNSYGFRSMALVPVKLEDRITGFMQLANKKEGGIPAAVIEAVESISEQFKLALDRVALKNEMQKQRESLLNQMHDRGAHLGALSERLKQEISERKKAQEEMRLQRDLALALNDIDSLDEALERCLDAAMRASGADAGGVYVSEKGSGDFVLMQHKGFSGEFRSRAGRLSFSTAIAQLIMNNKPVYVGPGEIAAVLDESYGDEGLKSSAVIPIAHDDKVVACLNVGSHLLEEIPVSVRNSLEAVAAEIGMVITRIVAREALAESEEKYRTLFSRTTSPILVIDSDGNYLDANDAALAFLECTRDELLAMNVKDTLPPYLDDQWFEHYKTVWESGGTVERDYYVWGKIKVMEMTVTPLMVGSRRMIFGIGKDITERKESEEALRKSEEKFKSLVEQIEEVFFIQDENYKFTYLSPQVERIIGYSIDEMNEKWSAMAIDNPANETALEAVRTAARTGERSAPFRWELRSKGGEIRILETNQAPVKDKDGRFIGFMGTARDVTEHVIMEQTLRESEAKYRSVVESGGAGVATTDLNGVLTFVNDSLCKITGYSKDEMVGAEFGRFIHEDDREAIVKLFLDVVGGAPAAKYVEFRGVAKDGSVVWLCTNPAELIIDGRLVGFSAILQDVTEGKKAEARVQMSEEIFREMADRLPQVVFELDNDGNFTYMNSPGYELWGYARDEVIGKLSVFDLIIPEEHAKARANYSRMATGEKSTGNEYTGVKKDGSTFNAIAFSNPIVKDGKVMGLRGFFTDITSIKMTERALRESESKYRSVVENAAEGILVVQDGQFKYANDRLIQFSQYTREEARRLVTERSFIDLIYPDDREMVLENYRVRAAGGDTSGQYEFRWLDKDGSVRWAEIRVSGFMWEGRPAALCLITNLTAHKKADEALAMSEQKYRLLADNALDVIWTTNMDLEVDYISPSVRYLIGRSPEEIMNMYRQKALTPEAIGISEEDARRIGEGMHTLLGDPTRAQAFELELRHQDGFTAWIEIKMIVMRDRSGKAAGILGIVRDISHQKKITQRLISADRLASLGEMAAGLAHEVNNPLTAVMGFAYLLQQNPDTPPEIRNDVEAIYREGKRAAEVIKNFLIFARGQKPEKQAIYINDIVEGVLRLRHSQMEKENIEVLLNLADDLPAIQGDVSQLQQVFLNIILNAEYFMYRSHRRGKLTLDTTLADGGVKVTIADDGPGIPPDRLNRVFDPFYTTKDVGEGTGLGLSICHGIVREHGGEIYAESVPGGGAAFTVELPVGK